MNTEVFDFDKTLTYADTTLALFSHNQTLGKRVAIFFTYYALALLVKAKLLKVANLKALLLNLFFASWEESDFEGHCEAFSSSIRTNELYAQSNWREGHKYIVSASFEAVLRPLFPEQVTIIGSKIQKIKGRWQVTVHAFGSRKAALLQKKGITQVWRVYTDSHSDRFMMAMAKEIVWVEGDKTTNFSRTGWESKYGTLPKI